MFFPESLEPEKTQNISSRIKFSFISDYDSDFCVSSVLLHFVAIFVRILNFLYFRKSRKAIGLIKSWRSEELNTFVAVGREEIFTVIFSRVKIA